MRVRLFKGVFCIQTSRSQSHKATERRKREQSMRIKNENLISKVKSVGMKLLVN